MKRKLEPIKLKTSEKEAWMYINKGSLEVFIYYEDGKNPISAKIMLKQIKENLQNRLSKRGGVYMKKYLIRMNCSSFQDVAVEANTKEEAKDKAYSEAHCPQNGMEFGEFLTHPH